LLVTVPFVNCASVLTAPFVAVCVNVSEEPMDIGTEGAPDGFTRCAPEAIPSKAPPRAPVACNRLNSFDLDAAFQVPPRMNASAVTLLVEVETTRWTFALEATVDVALPGLAVAEIPA